MDFWVIIGKASSILTIFLFFEAKASFFKKLLVLTWGHIDQCLQHINVLMDFINNADSKSSFLIYLGIMSFISILTFIESLLANGM